MGREWVVPLSLGQEGGSLRWLAGVFDALPARDAPRVLRGKQERAEEGARGEDEGQERAEEDEGDAKGEGKDGDGDTDDWLTSLPNPKRVLLAMKARDGMGGDGTVAYYVCLEGEVKPRQNG